MRNMDGYLGALLWVALATLLPMTALQPVAAGAPAARAVVVVFDPCGGSPQLVMGCASMSL
jgi:hypothetical protein